MAEGKFAKMITKEIKVEKLQEVKRDPIPSEDKEPIFTLEKKNKKKEIKKTFPIYMIEEKVKKLDRLCNKYDLNRNELINKMIDFALEQYRE